ncbi:hypothetical protein KAFR_0L01590 [Kazachstania africana CBS 2517]|uniref:Uncharacterized protein n=1 Tax=Kazachstania africana (strain ATCC 22294 / BCRC 22015 / CBS 2517 / CECT 1963 / NBRC 1671 / NRRL Y-8276) TaxID=1071382 RepID=H2B2B9_KAZAF|nr:hypothetical protein KAFR_0L01590 [Kazachstania africana CBS 2517]CCF60769.1 hypothetical protein KAFR_0L01590 [Kazachstania africana CBS 2517]
MVSEVMRSSRISSCLDEQNKENFVRLWESTSSWNPPSRKITWRTGRPRMLPVGLPSRNTKLVRVLTERPINLANHSSHLLNEVLKETTKFDSNSISSATDPIIRDNVHEFNAELEKDNDILNYGKTRNLSSNNTNNRFSFISSTSTEFDPLDSFHNTALINDMDMKIKCLELQVNELKLQNERLINTMNENQLIRKINELETQFNDLKQARHDHHHHHHHQPKNRILRISTKELKKIEEHSTESSYSSSDSSSDSSCSDSDVETTPENLPNMRKTGFQLHLPVL